MKVKRLGLKLKHYRSFSEVIKAIQMVAASDLKELKEDLLERYDFFNAFIHFFVDVVVHTIKKDKEDGDEGEDEEEEDEEEEEGEEDKNINNMLVLPITIDKNCCGPHNYNIFNATKSALDTSVEEGYDTIIAPIGERGGYYYRVKYNKKRLIKLPKLHFDELTISTSYSIVTTLLLEKGLASMIFIFNRFLSVFKTICSNYEVPRFEGFFGNVCDLEKTHLMLFARSVLSKGKEEMNLIYVFCVSMLLLDSLFENEYTAVSGRIASMTEASKNIKEMIEKTFLEYNKARQESITNEIIEVGVHMLI